MPQGGHSFFFSLEFPQNTNQGTQNVKERGKRGGMGHAHSESADRRVIPDAPIGFDQVHGDPLNLMLQIGGVIQRGLPGDHPQNGRFDLHRDDGAFQLMATQAGRDFIHQYGNAGHDFFLRHQIMFEVHAPADEF